MRFFKFATTFRFLCSRCSLETFFRAHGVIRAEQVPRMLNIGYVDTFRVKQTRMYVQVECKVLGMEITLVYIHVHLQLHEYTNAIMR